MGKKTHAQKLRRLEGIVIGAGFLLRKLQGEYGHDFGMGMDGQVRQCINDCLNVERAVVQREAAAGDKQ